jgi:hypothetical protein
MTREQVLDTYAGFPLQFRSFYKYIFTFATEAPDGAQIVAQIGGDHHEIYRMYVSASEQIYLGDANLLSLSVVKDGEEIFSEYFGL